MFRKMLRKYKYNKKRTFLFLFLFVTLLAISLGYSFLSTSVGVNGVSKITASTWDVHFTNLVVDSTSVTATTPATISATDPTLINFSAQLDKPGDHYSFTVDVVNNGTIKALIDSIVMNPDVSDKKYLTYTVTYSDGTAISKNDVLNPSGDKKTIKVVMRYEECEWNTDYPAELTPLDIEFRVNYIQNFVK